MRAINFARVPLPAALCAMASEHAVTWTRQDAEIQYKGKDLGQVIAERDARIEALELALQDAGKVKPEWIEDLFAQVTVSKKMQSELTLTKKNMKALSTELKSVKAELRDSCKVDMFTDLQH